MTVLPNLISTTAFAALVGLTPRRVQQLISEGKLPGAGHGKISLADGIRALITFRVESELAKSAGEIAALDVERIRKLRLENDETERRLVRVDDALAAIDAIVGAIPADLSAVPARVTDDLTTRRRIEDEIDNSLTGLSRRFLRACADLEAGRDALGPQAEDDADDVGGPKPAIPAKRRKARAA